MIKQQTKSELITLSLIDLLGKMSFQSITIKDITDNCSISRRTFYNCFKDKYDVVTQMFYEIQNDSSCCEENALYTYLLSLYQNKKRAFEIWRKIFSDPLCCLYISESIFSSRYDFIAKYTKKTPDNYMKNLIKYQSSGEFRILYDWIMGDCKEKSSEIANIIVDAFPSDLKEIFNENLIYSNFQLYHHTPFGS